MNLQEVRNVYDRWAPFYNPTHSWSLPKRKLACKMLELQAGNRVLDLACGTGVNIPYLRSMVGSTGQVVGVDLSPRMLDVSRKIISRNRWENVRVVEADGAHLPMADNSFDKVICTYALNIIPEYVKAVEEVFRVLVRGGRFVSLEMTTGHSMPNWLAPICAVNPDHQAIEALQSVFKKVNLESYWAGTISLSICDKYG